MRLSPSPLLSQFQSSPLAETVWDDARISLTSHNRLLLVSSGREIECLFLFFDYTHMPLNFLFFFFQTHENMDYRIPVPALASFYFHSLANSSDPCPSALLGTHPLDLFTSGFTPLTPCPNRQCPFVAASLEARVCSEVTRSFLHFPEGNQLMPQPETFPEQNCLMVASSLPSDIYLGRLGTYSVTVTLELLGIGKWLQRVFCEACTIALAHSEFFDCLFCLFLLSLVCLSVCLSVLLFVCCSATSGEVGSDVQYSVWSSDTTNLNITVSEDFREDGAALRHQASVEALTSTHVYCNGCRFIWLN